MAREQDRSNERRIDRRRFLEGGAKAAAAWTALPAVALALEGCGGGEEAGAPAPSAPESSPMPDQGAAKPPPAEPKPAPTPSAGGGGTNQLVTEVPAVASVVTALQYVNQTQKPDQRCANCQLYTAGEGGRGKCQLFTQGLVKETGWCTSWIPKAS